MKEIHFKNHIDVEMFLESDPRLICANELVLVSIDQNLELQKIKKALAKISKTTSKTALKVNDQQYFESPFKEMIEEFADLKICLCVELHPNDKYIFNPEETRNIPFTKKYRRFAQLSEILKEDSLKYILEFIPHPETIDLLSPLIKQVFQLGVNEVIIHPAHLDINLHHKEMKSQLELLQIYSSQKGFIFFSISDPAHRFWEAKTKNIFGGPQWVDIDVSNKCNHNCVFCVSYSSESIKKLKEENGGAIPNDVKELLSSQIDTNNCLNLIHSLPEKTRMITFGGMGEPFTHPHIMDFILEARKRNFFVSVFSHFSHITKKEIKTLHDQCLNYREWYSDIHFIINLSAGSRENYVKIRPNQKQEVFDDILDKLEYIRDLRLKDDYGISFTIMSVTNRLNFKDIPKLVAIGKHTSANNLWIKPIELHGEELKALLIDEEEMTEYTKYLRLGLYFADRFNLDIKDRLILEKIIEDNQALLSKLDEAYSFRDQVENELQNSEFLSKLFFSAQSTKKEIFQNHPIPQNRICKWVDHHQHQSELVQSIEEVSNLEKYLDQGPKESELTEHHIKISTKNAQIASDYYNSNPCQIGYEYLRIEVSGNISPCCISKYPLDNIKQKDFFSVWFSSHYFSFRKKLENINTEKFHLYDKEWLFCQQCPHMLINKRYHSYQKIKWKN